MLVTKIARNAVNITFSSDEREAIETLAETCPELAIGNVGDFVRVSMRPAQENLDMFVGVKCNGNQSPS